MDDLHVKAPDEHGLVVWALATLIVVCAFVGGVVCCEIGCDILLDRGSRPRGDRPRRPLNERQP